ncbi:MAG: DUF3794 domain-containing protein [Oscillospiraceae bacterium]|nr:DUF3794 domain-containing protein [Oscillospiraceae bacterium]
MKLHFEKNVISCLDTPLREVQNCEQTQEIKLPDGMPDIGSILCAWGQVILRGKEWRGDSVSCNGGMMVWVLYQPEDGSAERCMDAWIPFQMHWDLPEGTPEGTLRIRCLTRFVDARNVSPRRIMVRAGVAAMAEAFAPATAEVFSPEETGEEVQLLRSTYPVRLYQEAGERSFLMDEELTVPDSAPKPESLIYYRMNPTVTEKKVLGDKVVFRGNGNLHTLYRSEEGQLYGWDFDLPFSQYAQLDGEYGQEAQAELVPVPTNMELELDDEGHFRFKGAMTAQYAISDRKLLEVTEDAYSPTRELGVQVENLELPVVLENRRENLYAEQTLPIQANIAVDTGVLPDFPRQRRTENEVELEVPGTFQVLYYGEDGVLRSGTARWESRQRLKADEGSILSAVPVIRDPQAMVGNGQLQLKAEVPLELTASANQRLNMVSGGELGDARSLDPNRPALILRRAGEDRLWDIAKSSGSTVGAIRQANQLSEEPQPGQMLLIPVN